MSRGAVFPEKSMVVSLLLGCRSLLLKPRKRRVSDRDN